MQKIYTPSNIEKKLKIFTTNVLKIKVVIVIEV